MATSLEKLVARAEIGVEEKGNTGRHQGIQVNFRIDPHQVKMIDAIAKLVGSTRPRITKQLIDIGLERFDKAAPEEVKAVIEDLLSKSTQSN